jgi:hypothetical protein
MKNTDKAVTDSGKAPSVSENKKIGRAYAEIQKLRDAHYSLSQSAGNDTDKHAHVLVAQAYDKALGALRAAFNLAPQSWEVS